MAEIVKEERVIREPRDTVVVEDRDGPRGVSAGGILLGILLVLVILFLLFGRGMGGGGGGAGVDVQMPAPTVPSAQ